MHAALKTAESVTSLRGSTTTIRSSVVRTQSLPAVSSTVNSLNDEWTSRSRDCAFCHVALPFCRRYEMNWNTQIRSIALDSESATQAISLLEDQHNVENCLENDAAAEEVQKPSFALR